jgi:hypothetical protein
MNRARSGIEGVLYEFENGDLIVSDKLAAEDAF